MLFYDFITSMVTMLYGKDPSFGVPKHETYYFTAYVQNIM